MKLNAQVAMKLHPLGNVVEFVRPLTKDWRTFDVNITLAKKLWEYVMLVERAFSSITLLEDRLRNRKLRQSP